MGADQRKNPFTTEVTEEHGGQQDRRDRKAKELAENHANGPGSRRDRGKPDEQSTRSLRPTRALMNARTRLTAIGMTIFGCHRWNSAEGSSRSGQGCTPKWADCKAGKQLIPWRLRIVTGISQVSENGILS